MLIYRTVSPFDRAAFPAARGGVPQSKKYTRIFGIFQEISEKTEISLRAGSDAPEGGLFYADIC